MPTFKSVVYLDDMRQPLLLGVRWVKNYAEFVADLEKNGIPDLISFDHDLAKEHYPIFEEDTPGREIPYGTYAEKTGLHCARYIVENKLPLQHWAVHSFNPQGRANIEAELRAYHPQGEVRGLEIMYRRIEDKVYGGDVVGGYRTPDGRFRGRVI